MVKHNLDSESKPSRLRLYASETEYPRHHFRLSRLGLRLPPWAVQTLLVFLLSRCVVATAALTAKWLRPHQPLHSWDAVYYIFIAQHGYASNLSSRVPGAHGSSLAFFPAFPLTVRGVAAVVGGHWLVVAYALNLVLGCITAVGLRMLATQLWDGETGDKAVALWVFWPGSAALSLPYSEPLALSAAVFGFVALGRGHFILAGCLGAIATATRPNMLPLVVAFAVAGGLNAWQRGEWKPLLAPVLAPFGAMAYFGYTWRHVGSITAWSEAEKRYWHSRLDFGTHLPAYLARNLRPPFTIQSPQAYLLVVGSLVILVALCCVPWLPRTREVLFVSLLIFTVCVLFQVFVYTNLGPRPRFITAAFPLFLFLAQRLSWRAVTIWTLLSCGGLALTTVLYLASPLTYP